MYAQYLSDTSTWITLNIRSLILVPPEFVSDKIEGERSGGQGYGQATTEAWNRG